MAKMRFTRFAAVAAATALALTACADRGGDPVETPSDESGSNVEPGVFPQESGGDPVSGGRLTYADFGEARSLDPTVTGPTAAQGATSLVAIYDQLMRWNVEAGKFEAQLAESVIANDDFTEWTITLRPDVNFTDGTPLNADAVIGSMEYYMNSMGFDVSLIEPLWGGAEKIDDLTIKITLNDSWASFDAMLARGLGFIVAPAGIANGPDAFEPIGAGPFVESSYAPGESRTFTPNPDYWNGKPYLDEVKVVWLGGDQTAYETVKGGTAHAGFIQSSPTVVADVVDDGFPRYTFLSNNGQVIMLNEGEGHPGQYDQVRKALALATDPEAMHERVHDGEGYYGRTMFAPVSRWYDGSVETLDYDPEAATELLTEAKAEGFDGAIDLIGLESSTEAMLSLKGTWEAAGFVVETETVRTVADWIQLNYVERSYSTSVSGFQLIDADPYQNLFSSFHSESATNILNYSNPDMDALIEEFRATPADDPHAQEVINQIEELYQETVPTITVQYYTPTIFWQDTVYGIAGLNEGMADFSKAWIQR